MKTVFHRYVAALSVFVAVGVLFPVLFNFVIDPYGLWRVINVRGVNLVKPERRDQSHLFKSFDLRKPLPPVLIIGSSRTAYGLNPSHPALLELGGAYNSAFPGGHLTVIRANLEFALEAHSQQITTVIYGIDFFEFSEAVFHRLPNTFTQQRLQSERPALDDLVVSLYTLDSLRASFATVVSNHRDPDYQAFSPQGQLTAMDVERQVERRGLLGRFRESLDLYLNAPHRFGLFQWSEPALEEFRRIVDICRRHQVQFVGFVPPTHVAHLEAIRERGLWDDFENWKRRISEITPFWDFSGYNEVTSEPISNRMKKYWDISHYRSDVGDLVLHRIFQADSGSSPSGFGRSVELTNVEAVLEEINTARERWLRSNSDLIAIVQEARKDH